MNDSKTDSGSSFFREKLRFWTVHCLINAVPSYLIVMVWFDQWENPVAHLAMVSAVLTFIFGYAVVTSLPGPLRNKKSIFSGALKAGLAIRAVFSSWTLVFVQLGPLMLFTPDFWCGQLANAIVAYGFDAMGEQASLAAWLDDRGPTENLPLPGFLEIYLTTVMEGLILSFMVFIFSVMAVVILQRKAVRKLYSGGTGGV